MGQVAQPQAHHLAERMGHQRQLLQVHRRVDLHVAERVEVLTGMFSFSAKNWAV